jgi:hypothetical protein
MHPGSFSPTTRTLINLLAACSWKSFLAKAAVLWAIFGLTVLTRVFDPEIAELYRPSRFPSKGIPIAMLGDSGSQGYGDTRHGGAYHDITWGWPDIWALRRPSEVDLGHVDEWGTSYRIAKIRARLGLPARSPTRYDFDNNYAESGMFCESLLQSEDQTARWLLDRMRREPARWNRGLVIIRMGLMDFGLPDSLDIWSKTGLDARARSRVGGCLEPIRTVVAEIRKLGAARVALIGISRIYNLPGGDDRWPEHVQLQRIEEVLAYYDAQLGKLAERDDLVAFVDDMQWFRDRLGDQLTGTLGSTFMLEGKAIYRALGDEPDNLLVKDTHFGTVYNGLWLNSLIAQLNARFGLGFTPITEAEILQMISHDKTSRR